MDLTDETKFKEVNTDVNLMSVEGLKQTGQSIKIEHIFFDFDRYELKEESFQSLNLLIKFLSLNSNVSIEINAYTDNVGSDSYNLSLSEKRAASVVGYLVKKGI